MKMEMTLRRDIERWFQTVEAAKEKDMRPSSLLINEKESRFEEE